MSENKAKIILLGESVALGFLYAPYYTPALYLNNILEKNGINCLVEDRTKVSIRMPELIERCVLAAEEKPDYVIIFAGSNWRKSLWDITEMENHQIYEYIVTGTPWYQAVREVFTVKAVDQINNFFGKMRSLFVECGIKTLFVLPGFNLKDWHYGHYDTELNSPDGVTNRWKHVISSPISYENAQEMINLDPANPLGYKIMAELAYKDQDMEIARKMYQNALNTNLYRPGPPPAGNDVITDCVMKASRATEILCCDASEVIADYLGGDIPGNDLYIDYCHFTDKGIRIICTRIAQYILFWNHKELNVIPESEPDKIVSSHAHFYSAIHSAHLGNLSKDYLLYHLRKAHDIYHGIADKMIKYCRLASKKTPWYLSELFIDIDTIQYPAIRKQEDCMVMDIELVDTMIMVLKENGIDIQNEIEELRITSHTSEGTVKINLLENYYKESSYFYVFAGSQSADPDSRKKLYTSFRSQYSNFHLILSKVTDILCDFIFRVPYASLAENISLKINDTEFYSGEVSDTWLRVKTDIPAKLLKRGMNLLSICWPDITKSAKDTIYFQKHIMDYIRPVYGDVLHFIIKEDMPSHVKLEGNCAAIYSRHMVGNKGHNLLKLCQMNINVPEGFILPAYICREYYQDNKIMKSKLKQLVISSIEELEHSSGRRLNDKNNPLIFSIRSGAAVSMPGMLDTILNVGFSEDICQQAYQFHAYISFIKSYAKAVKNITLKAYNTEGLGTEKLRNVLTMYKQDYQKETGEPFPENSIDCILHCVEAVFKSWDKSSAVLYRKNKKISNDLYTAVIFQRMVFGNMNSNSGTGVVFSQNPITKEKKIYGEYLVCSQGEDIVSGILDPQPIEQLSKTNPDIYKELNDTVRRMEDYFGRPQDIEFTYENKKVYILQTRDMPI